MKTATKTTRSAASRKPKKGMTKPKARTQTTLAVAYQKYFAAPPATPDSFRIFDLSEGAAVSYSSHT